MKHLKLISKSELDLNNKISAITKRIQKEFPELSTYLNKLPLINTTPNSLETTAEILNNQYESLFNFLENYKLNSLKKGDTN